ncbi:hypothetical protein RHMOL_Rhmol13G0242500 [Rhododendron molle]|uniref:Uncharacterized protein n=1 Tax=Rhododendron molle TaxID=49168 RepID=A0ACC0LAK8_RHOML|nr:hypothetical protein RHMOL_Rhmol13G0242500 [Rhododendron molle]
MPQPRRSRNKTRLAFSSLLSPLEVNLSSKIKSVVSFVTLLFILPGLISQNQAQQVSNHSIPAFFVFGDSYVDPGNNDYILTIAKSNSPPYGINFLNQIATCRFSNGKLIADFFGGQNLFFYIVFSIKILCQPGPWHWPAMTWPAAGLLCPSQNKPNFGDWGRGLICPTSLLGFQNYSYVPYLAPNFTIQSQRAVGFTSAGSGFDNRTAAFLVSLSLSD